MPKRIGYKSRVAYGNGDGPPETFTEVANQSTSTPADPRFDKVEVTDQDSPGFTKEYLPTMLDPGNVAFEGYYVAEDATQSKMRQLRDTAAVQNFRVNVRDPQTGAVVATCTFPGFVESFTLGPLEPKTPQMYKGSICATGKEVWTP